MQHIEDKWLKNQSNCSDPNPDLSHNPLSLSSFWGLFLIAGLASFLALILSVANFLYEHKHTLYDDDSHNSSWRKLKILLRIFDEKDKKFHMFKESAVHNVSSPSTQCTPRPSTVEITPWSRSPSQNMEFEPRRVSLVPSEEFSTPQLENQDDEEVDTECGVK